MAATRKTSASGNTPRRPPATTPEARENQMIALAVDLAERQLLNGSATSQVITHYLKLATTRERLEQEKLTRENELLKAKSKALESDKRLEDLFNNAMNAFRGYSGQEVQDESDDY